jgi:hypothetical protein
MDADNRAHAPESAMPDQIPAIINRLNVLKTSIPKKGEKLPITGNDLISLGLSPGPLFTRLLNIVKDKQLENPNTTREEYIDLIKNIIKHEL